MSEQIQIKRAKAFFEYKSENYNYITNAERDMYLTVNQVLQAELDRQENKALTLSELKEMVGEPVWCEVEGRDYKGWVLLKEVNDKTLTDLGINFPYELARPIFEVNTFAKYYKHKPTEGVGR